MTLAPNRLKRVHPELMVDALQTDNREQGHKSDRRTDLQLTVSGELRVVNVRERENQPDHKRDPDDDQLEVNLADEPLLPEHGDNSLHE